MKKKDLKKCAICHQGMMHDNSMQFFKIEISNCIINMSAVQETHGLETLFGGGSQAAALASVMGSDPHIASESEPVSLLVCQSCALKPYMIAALMGDDS